MSEWKDEPAPTHRCKVCGGLWRFWRKSETPGATCDTWDMRSQCFDCCADAPMGDQIEPLTLGRMEQYLRARLAVDAMVQQHNTELLAECERLRGELRARGPRWADGGDAMAGALGGF